MHLEEANQQDPQIWLLKARSYAALGDAKQAMNHLHHALDLGFADPAALEKMMQEWALGRDGTMDELVQRAALRAGKTKKKPERGDPNESELKKMQHAGARKIGGFRVKPQPPGDPVAISVPGSSVNWWDK